MAIISVSGEAGCPFEELAGLIVHRLGAELLTAAGLEQMIGAEFLVAVPEKAWKWAVQLILARMGVHKHVVACAPYVAGALRELSYALRVNVTPRMRRHSPQFDLVLNPVTFSPPQMLEIVVATVRLKALDDGIFLSSMAEAEVEYKARLMLAKYGITPELNGQSGAGQFTHPSEQIFANLLDFYRIRWEYEPRSFPLQWDKDGRVTEAFTPDFYLPEMELYVEITTMKQSLVTKKNRKVRLLRAIYPHVNIQVFYQKDFQELVNKYGLADRIPG